MQVLANAHTLLSDRGWRDVSLDDLVQQQIIAAENIRITGQQPHVMVPPLAIQAISLVIHELLFNAEVHGALSEPGGLLAVSWEVDPATDGFVLTWAEAVASVLGEPGPAGFGSMMIQSMVGKQLRGDVQRVWSPHGLTVTLHVPAPSSPVAAASSR